jgi:hypothetical protein
MSRRLPFHARYTPSVAGEERHFEHLRAMRPGTVVGSDLDDQAGESIVRLDYRLRRWSRDAKRGSSLGVEPCIKGGDVTPRS